MPLSSKGRAALRAEAHHLDPIVHVGHHGLTDALRQTLNDALYQLYIQDEVSLEECLKHSGDPNEFLRMAGQPMPN